MNPSPPRRSRRDAATRAARPDDAVVAGLAELGLTLAQSRVYAALLEMPDERAANIATRAGVSRTKIYETLQSLEAYGFAASEGDRRTIYRPVAPEVAIPHWIEARKRRRRLDEERDEEAGQQLIRALPSPGDNGAEEDQGEFETIIGETRTGAVLPRFARRAQRTLDIMMMPPFTQPRREWNVAEAEALARGVRVRIVVDARVLDEEARIKEALELGAQIRAEAVTPLKILVRDRTEGAISIRHPTPRERGVTTLVMRQPDLVQALGKVFERAWRSAVRVTLTSSGELRLHGSPGKPD